MSITSEQITAVLRKLGPVSPRDLANHLGVSRQVLKDPVKAALAEGTLKAAGATKSRLLALPDQKLDGTTSTPPQHRKPSRKKKGAVVGSKRKAKTRAPRAARPAATAERFIPTIDAESRLVIVNGGEPVIFTGPQTEGIAQLLFQHYKA